MTATIPTAKPRIVIGKGGASVDQLREDLEKRCGSRVRISIQEIKQPELDAQLVAENIASQIERRISYKRAMKQAILRTMRSGAKGVRIYCGGRLRRPPMARPERDPEGPEPLPTPRAHPPKEGSQIMLIPKRVRSRRWPRGRPTGIAPRGAPGAFGAFGLRAMEACWMTTRQIGPARRAMTRHVKRGGQIWIRVFPDKSITKKPAETQMGSAKSNPEGTVAVVKPGRIVFEIGGATAEVAKEEMRMSAQTRPI